MAESGWPHKAPVQTDGLVLFYATVARSADRSSYVLNARCAWCGWDLSCEEPHAFLDHAYGHLNPRRSE